RRTHFTFENLVVEVFTFGLVRPDEGFGVDVQDSFLYAGYFRNANVLSIDLLGCDICFAYDVWVDQNVLADPGTGQIFSEAGRAADSYINYAAALQSFEVVRLTNPTKRLR